MDRRAVASTPSLIYGTCCTRKVLLANSYWMQQAHSGDRSRLSCPVDVFSFSLLFFLLPMAHTSRPAVSRYYSTQIFGLRQVKPRCYLALIAASGRARDLSRWWICGHSRPAASLVQTKIMVLTTELGYLALMAKTRRWPYKALPIPACREIIVRSKRLI